MQDAAAETICARLCLLTRAAWRDDLPAPLTRTAARQLYDRGALTGLVLREDAGVSPALLERARALLTRTGEVYDLLRAYRREGYRVLLPEDRNWPTALLAMGAQMPLFLFARGDVSLLGGRRVAVAGSRQIGPRTLELARSTGQALAREGITMVSGGARGVDSAAQEGLLRSGGRLILVPAVPAQRLLAGPLVHKAIAEDRLLLLCDTLPDAPFSAQRALGRNAVIYALGSAALVLAAREGTGGSWRGATQCIKRGYAPVFVPEREYSYDQAGCRALKELGAGTFSLGEGQTLAGQLFAKQR